MSLLSRIGHEVKALSNSLPFSRFGSGWGSSGYYGNDLWYSSSLPGTNFDYRGAAGILWQNPSAAACFVALTKAFAQARPMLEQRKGKEWSAVDDHPLVQHMNRPNPFYSGERMCGVTLISMMANQGAYWRIVRDRKGDPAQLWFEPPVGVGPTGMAPNWDTTNFIKDYSYFVDGKKWSEAIPRTDAVYFRYGLDPRNPRYPWSPLDLASREVATLNGASTWTASVLRNGGAPGGMLTMPDGYTGDWPNADQMEAAKKLFSQQFTGEGAGGTFASTFPFKYQGVTWSPEQMALKTIQTWPQGIVCALLGTPEVVALLPTGEQPTYENLNASMRWWWDNTIIPLEDAMADEIETQLFEAYELDPADYRVVWDRSKVPALQEDEQAKHQMIREDYKSGVYDLYTAQQKLGMEPDEEMKGKFYQPAPKPGSGDGQDMPPEANAPAAKSFNPNEPRDKDGKWATGGGSGSSSSGARKGDMRAATADERKALGIPPAYTDVMITDDPHADLRATAKSSKGKVQYYYSPEYSQKQAAAKFDRVKEVHQALPAMREKWNAEIAARGPNAHEAMALRLISQTGFRVGGLEGGGDVAAYGASSLLTSHAKVTGDRIEFDFKGKGGHTQQHSLIDPVLAAHIKKRQSEGKETIFDTNDAKVRDYLKKTGGDFKVHDLRTRTASAMAAHYVGTIDKKGKTPRSEKQYKAAKNAIADKVAKKLGDTRSVVLSSYIAPQIWQEWESHL